MSKPRFGWGGGLTANSFSKGSTSKATEETALGIYLLHVQLNHIGQVSAWLVVAEEGSLQGPLIQEVHWVSLEFSIFVWHTNQHSHTPSLY